MQKITFGPIVSRRFGVSLGVDLSPSNKQCNFDCLYCELGGAKTTQSMQEVLPLQEVLNAIETALKKEQNIDVLTITANGEPTLYPHFTALSSKLKPLVQGRCKTLILSNGSRFLIPEVQKGLLEFDIVKFSLDCVSEKIFKKIDRPHKSLHINEILQGIQEFATLYQGELVCEILVLENLNDTQEEMEKIAEFTQKIKVARIDLGTLDRPPAYKAKGVEIEKLRELALSFKGQCVSIPMREQYSMEHKLKPKDANEVYDIISRRPIGVEECSILFDDGVDLIQELLQAERIVVKKVANMDFFVINS
ncbi:hypothetical protein BBW65_06125 [Helicobacter enhydrae]|uniref:Radical SAM core domain-containing protein n=1 Tax=Helicobacter enhydrae TaxID=222136 RepID=A0A1B1U6H2_9HELI|nr:radical SAM protein [Helicobacter enhydrae]ANV98397.1 hypothetical protein BBW65_06125 [Helicobacter enhydrae]